MGYLVWRNSSEPLKISHFALGKCNFDVKGMSKMRWSKVSHVNHPSQTGLGSNLGRPKVARRDEGGPCNDANITGISYSNFFEISHFCDIK